MFSYLKADDKAKYLKCPLQTSIGKLKTTPVSKPANQYCLLNGLQ